MQKKELNKWAVLLSGLFALGGLLALALFFWQQRALYIDMAFHTYILAQTKTTAIQNYRFGAAFTQFFPLTAIKLQLPLSVVLKCYSASFYIVYLVYFIVIVFVFKRPAMGIVLLLSNLMLTSWSFYWAQSELPQGLSFLVLFLSAVLGFSSYPKPGIFKLLILFALMVTAVFFHPLLIIPLVFCLIYFLLNKNIELKYLIALVVTGGLIIVVKNFVLTLGNYESGKMGGVNNLIKFFPNYLSIPSNMFFASQLIKNYALFSILFIWVSAFYVYKKDWQKLSWLFLSVMGYTLLINVSFPVLTEGTYLQNMHLPLALLVSLPFAMEVLPTLQTKIWFPLLLAAVVVRFYVIYNSNTIFTARFNWLRNATDQTHRFEGNRFIIADSSLINTVYFDTWGLPYETLLYSSLSSPDSARAIALESMTTKLDVADDDNLFINPYAWSSADGVPSEYFRLGRGRYKKIELNAQ